MCKMCKGRFNLEVDHIKPLVRGGSHYKSNLQVLCKICHNAKTQKDFDREVKGKREWKLFLSQEVSRAKHRSV